MQTSQLALYQFDSCPFCARVRDAVTRLGLDLELRDVREVPAYRSELQAATGRTTVPCLRIEQPGGPVWMHESADIVAFLDKHFGGSGAS